MSESRVLLRQLVGYGVVGAVQLGLDWLAFVLFTHFGVSVVMANVAARVFGAGVGFALNGALTFRDQEGKATLGWRRLGRFLVSWAIMTLLSTGGVEYVSRVFGLTWAWLFKPAIDIFLAGLGFLVSRYWIYK